MDQTLPHDWPVSRQFHQVSSLTPRNISDFGQTITRHAAAVTAGTAPPAAKRYGDVPRVPLPSPAAGRGLSLAAALSQRRTRRRFTGGTLTLPVLAALLEGSAGITGRIPQAPAGAALTLRAWPSAGGLYPLELYALPLLATGLRPAVYHHDPHERCLEQVAPLPERQRLEQIVFAQGLWEGAALLLVLTGVLARTQAKYGERGYRFVHQEAGHLMQNLLLLAEDLALGAVALGGFFEAELADVLHVDAATEPPLYAVLLGTVA